MHGGYSLILFTYNNRDGKHADLAGFDWIDLV
jgi:hypothetical protein